jgi:MFS family permease
MLLGARGLGAGLGPIIAARFTRGKVSRVLQVCGIAGLSCSFFYLFAGVAPVIYLAALFIALAHLGGGSQWTLSTYGLQLRTPDHIRGRVLAGDFAIVTLVMTFSGLGAGVLSSATSVRPTIITFSLVGAIAGFAYLRYTKPIIARLRDEEAALPH